VFFPTHFLANHPDAQIIMISHTQELSERFGRRARNMIDEHGTTLGLQLSDDSQAAGRWTLKSGGSLFAVGASGALAGYRADCVILDDVYRSMEDAYSENIRKKISDWFFSDVLVRCRPGARIVAIGTRFHFSDLLAELEETGRYKTIKLNAIAEEDDELGRPPAQDLPRCRDDPLPALEGNSRPEHRRPHGGPWLISPGPGAVAQRFRQRDAGISGIN
jgi:hypothetical protein